MPGLYGQYKAKNGDMTLRSKSIMAETKALSAAQQNGTAIEIPNLGDLVGFSVQLSVTAAGTLSSAQTINRAIAEIRILTRSGKNISQSINGTDLNLLQYLSSRYGKSESWASAVQNTAETNQFVLQWSVDSKDLPAKIQVVYAPYSVLATSGCTGASVTFTVTGMYRDGSTDVTEGVTKTTVSLAIGTNSIASYLPRGKRITAIALGLTEAYLTEAVFSAAGGEEHDLLTADLQQYLDTARGAAHISGYLLLPVTPFVASDRTVLKLINGTADTLSLYVFYTEAPPA
ncbi:MAG: hypothetical protein PHV13_02955 [Candidatus ainarchaeum sp.]|nr:hypothetical protein [Candidatus ainarchaeum sp.]